MKAVPLSHPEFEIVTTTAGAISIRNKVVNEIMHNPVGPWVEANSLYIDQSKLRERLKHAESSGEEIVIFDVGLGAGANALATLHAAMEANAHVCLVSFEKNLELLRFALHHADQFAHFQGYESAIEQILKTGSWTRKGIRWVLREGDFLQQVQIETESPHFIFFDPYSPNVSQDMWSMECFKRLRAKCRSGDRGGTVLFTYSQATRIRAALIQAGFFVGIGAPTGEKNGTTVAATKRELLTSPLNLRWYERWQRSSARYPFDCLPPDQPGCDSAIKKYFESFA